MDIQLTIKSLTSIQATDDDQELDIQLTIKKFDLNTSLT